MKILKYTIIFICFFLVEIVCFAQKEKIEYSKYVDSFIGTGGHGHTYPGAVVPFGMMQLSPDTRLDSWDGCSGYHYSDSVIYGFTHTHLSGTGCSDYGDILLMPVTGSSTTDSKKYTASFSHKNEKAAAGYYSVKFDNGIDVELSVSTRAGIHKYTFPDAKDAFVVLDLMHRDKVLESSLKIIDNRRISGMRRSEAWAKDQHVYFVAEFSQPFSKWEIDENGNQKPMLKESNSSAIKACFHFDPLPEKQVMVRIGISSVSVEGAMKNLKMEINHWDFLKVKKEAAVLWNSELSKIEIKGATAEQMKIFYTALYHTMVVPNVNMDVDGRYRGMDNKIHKAEGFTYYTVFSLWDTFRAAHPLYTIIDRKRTLDFIKTFLVQYQQGGRLPVWELSSNETDCMIGYHSVSVIADAFMKGINDFDISLAFEAMKKSATWNHLGLPAYMEQGFIAVDDEHESVSKTLEYGYNDWCIAQVAKSLGKKKDYKNFTIRSQAYKNLFDKETCYMRPRKNGNWITPFDPREVNNHYTEANSWQYSFFVPHDISGLIQLHGGTENFSTKLDQLFTEKNKTTGREQVDITGLVGQYAHGNEPSHHIAYLYNYAGKPWKTQERVHQLLNKMYSIHPDGLIGNEDCGQMSAWYILSALGFYSVNPGNTQFIIGTPLFPSAKIHLENGKTFIIEGAKSKPSDFYIKRALLNNITYTKSFIDYSDIMQGGNFKIVLGEKHSEDFGVKPGDIPETKVSDFSIIPVPLIQSAGVSFKQKQEIKIVASDSSNKIYYTLDGTTPTAKSKLYTAPFFIDSTVQITSIAINTEEQSSKYVKAHFIKFPNEWRIKILSKYNPQYTAGGDEGIIDGIRGDVNWRKGEWQGYQGQDFEAIIDMGKEQLLGTFIASFLQDTRSWILFPKRVEFSLSLDGEKYYRTFESKLDEADDDYNIRIRECKVLPAGLNKARYVKVKATNYGILPKWHQGAGFEAFIFIDEIIIK